MSISSIQINRETNSSVYPIAGFLVSIPFLTQLFSVILIIVFVGNRAWDDGAITLAFSKTFAETGKIALTPASEQVEGFSSVSWFLINSLADLFHTTFDQSIMISQIGSALCVSISLFYIFLIGKNLNFPTPVVAVLMLIFGISGPAIAETANGMEMALMAASGLMLAYSIYLSNSRATAAIATIIFVSSRFEGIFYLPFLILPLVRRRRWLDAALLCALGGIVFLVIEGFRYYEFTELLPNTIYAKMHEPYREASLGGRLRAISELFVTFKPVVIFAVVLLCIAYAKKLFVPLNNVDFLISPILGAEVFSFLAGPNWGYNGRMQFFAVPFLLLAIGYVYTYASPHFGRMFRISCLFVALISIPYSWNASAANIVSEVARFKTNGSIENFGVTPASYRMTGEAVEHIRLLLNRDKIVFMTPDVGGLGLCCSNVRVIDVALLTNKVLAHGGYQSFPSVFLNEKPDVIEVHQLWAALPKLYERSDFASNFTPIIVNNTRLFLRNDHVAKLQNYGIGHFKSLSEIENINEIILGHRYRGHTTKEDDIQFFKYGQFFYIPS